MLEPCKYSERIPPSNVSMQMLDWDMPKDAGGSFRFASLQSEVGKVGFAKTKQNISSATGNAFYLADYIISLPLTYFVLTKAERQPDISDRQTDRQTDRQIPADK